MKTIKIKTTMDGIICLRRLIKHHLEHECTIGDIPEQLIFSLLLDQMRRYFTILPGLTKNKSFTLKYHDALALLVALQTAKARILADQTTTVDIHYVVNIGEQITQQLR